MPTPTYTPLANVSLTSATATVTFSSINQSFRDIVAVANIKGAEGKIWVSINAVGGYAYQGVAMESNGSTANSTYGGDSYIQIGRNLSGARTDTPTVLTMNFLDYSSGKNTPVLYRASNALSGIFAGSYRVMSNNAITSIIFQLESGNFSAGSTFAIYGVSA